MTCLQLHVVVQLFLWTYHLCEVRRPPEIDYPSHDEILYYRDYDEVVITCIIRGDTEATYHEFKWTKNGTVIQTSYDIEVSRETGLLHIRSFSRRSEAIYRCIVSTNIDEISPVVSTLSPAIFLRRLWIEPFLKRGIRQHRPEKFRFYSIECDDSRISTGPITYRWHDTGTRTPLNNDRMYAGLNGTLFFRVITTSDKGLSVICSISAILRGVEYSEWGSINNIIEIRTPANNNLEPTRLAYSSPPIVARRHSDVSMECIYTKSKGNDPYLENVFWFLQNGSEIEEGAKYRMQSGGKRLTIMNVTEEDEMYYTCRVHFYAINGPGKVFLNVTAEPVFTHRPPASRTVIQGGDAEFNCETVSAPGDVSPDPVVWYINAARMGSTYDRTKFQLSQKNKVLTVKNAQKATDIMCVQCEVSNKFCTAFADTCLDVLLPMIIVTKPPDIQRIVRGDVVNLTVTAQADPASHIQYRWEYGYYGFDLKSTPHYVISNPETMEVYINTSLLTADELEDITGHFNIVITSEYEKKVVGTDVIFISQTDTTTNFAGGTMSVGQETTLPRKVATGISVEHDEGSEPLISLNMIIGSALLALLFLLVIIAAVYFLARKKTAEEQTAAERQKGVKHDQSVWDSNATEAPVSKTSSGNLFISSSVDP